MLPAGAETVQVDHNFRLNFLFLRLRPSFTASTRLSEFESREIRDRDVMLRNIFKCPCESRLGRPVWQKYCGVDDSCLSNSIYYLMHPQDQVSGFYIAGCTQKPFQGPKCSKRCCE